MESKDNNEQLELEKEKKINPKKLIWEVLGVVEIVLIIFIIYCLVINPVNNNPIRTFDFVSTLEEMIEINELHTYRTIHNGVVTKFNDKKPEKVDCYIRYESIITAGIDFKSIILAVDEENKRVNITMPIIEIYEPEIKEKSIGYIFENEKADESGLYEDALRLCKDDVISETKNNETIKLFAKQNAENFIKGLIGPFIKEVDSEYSINIEWRDN